jgi:hypothetical protein
VHAIDELGRERNMEPTDDRVLPSTRLVAILVTPILAVAGILLVMFPAATEQLWAWPMGPPLTALAVGGGYLAGAVLFLRAARATSWHRIAAVFPAATVLTVLLLIATLLHWELFSHGHVSFWTWLVVYALTPMLLPVVWVRNRRRDPGRVPAGTSAVPQGVRALVGGAGVLQLGVALVFFVRPAAAIAVWPWDLSPLTARTLAAFLAFIGALWAWFLIEPRWSGLRLHVQSATIGLLLVAGGAVRASADLAARPAQVGVFVVLLAATIAGLVALQLFMRARSERVDLAGGAKATADG